MMKRILRSYRQVPQTMPFIDMVTMNFNPDPLEFKLIYNFMNPLYIDYSKVFLIPPTVLGVINTKTIDQYLKGQTKGEFKEFAIVGRSNVGKSSLINAMVQLQVAQVAKQPVRLLFQGKTQQLKLYQIGQSEIVLVDAPGYGYAKAPLEQMDSWKQITSKYFLNSVNLHHIYALIDSRIGIKQNDFQLFSYLESIEKYYTIVLTKVDKAKQKDCIECAKQMKERLQDFPKCSPIIHFTSSVTGYGILEFSARTIAQLSFDLNKLKPV